MCACDTDPSVRESTASLCFSPYILKERETRPRERESCFSSHDRNRDGDRPQSGGGCEWRVAAEAEEGEKGGKNQTEKSGTRTRVENMVLKCVVFVMGSFMVYTW